jgi:hypothetical protein
MLGLVEPGTRRVEGEHAMRLGSLVHEILERAAEPAATVLKEKGVGDLQAVFHSDEWQGLVKLDVERELPFIMHVEASGRDCILRGRMDAVTLGDCPRIVDYKYASWHTGAEVEYELQMATYCLATMNALDVEKAVGELWFLKSPLKIVRREFTRSESETIVTALVHKYLESIGSGEWPMAERAHCDAVSCGFRERCWAK